MYRIAGSPLDTVFYPVCLYVAFGGLASCGQPVYHRERIAHPSTSRTVTPWTNTLRMIIITATASRTFD